MRLAMTTQGCDGGRSGIGRYAVELLAAFARASSHPAVDVFVSASEERAFLGEGSPFHARHCSELLRQPLAGIAWHLAVLPFRATRERYDALFLPAGNRRLPLACGVPTVGTVHDLSLLHCPGKYDAFRTFYVTSVLARFVGRLTRVLTPSRASRDDIVRHCSVPSERVDVVANGVDVSRYAPRPAASVEALLAERYGLRRPYLLYVSRIEHPGKNHVRLLAAFDRLRARRPEPIRLVLAGSDWTRADAVHAAAARSPNARDILFTGFLPEADLPALYAGAEGLVFPSLYEGFGIPILEALASGLPVACSDVSSMPEVAGDLGLLFDPADEEAMAASMARLLDDGAFRARCREHGPARAASFTWDACAAATLESLGRAVDDERRRAA